MRPLPSDDPGRAGPALRRLSRQVQRTKRRAQLTYRQPCMWCGQDHESEYWDDVDAALETCRGRASPKDRGELAAYAEEGLPQLPWLRVLAQERAA